MPLRFDSMRQGRCDACGRWVDFATLRRMWRDSGVIETVNLLLKSDLDTTWNWTGAAEDNLGAISLGARDDATYWCGSSGFALRNGAYTYRGNGTIYSQPILDASGYDAGADYYIRGVIGYYQEDTPVSGASFEVGACDDSFSVNYLIGTLALGEASSRRFSYRTGLNIGDPPINTDDVCFYVTASGLTTERWWVQQLSIVPTAVDPEIADYTFASTSGQRIVIGTGNPQKILPTRGVLVVCPRCVEVVRRKAPDPIKIEPAPEQVPIELREGEEH